MDNIGVYIHIPFCEQKCPYCDFYSISDKVEYDNYVQHLVDTICAYGKNYNRVVDTVYFGGGTPSVLGTSRLVSILKSVRNCFTVTNDAEITLEVNPCSASMLDFKCLNTAGFNRLSIGLQSAVCSELRTLCRRHSAEEARNTVQTARESGFDNISLDLMLCVPGQTKNSLTESVRFCKDCGVEHISAYILKIEENTHFYKIKDKLNLFSDDEQSEIYLHAVNELERCGYIQYEISNFSKPGYEGKHNLKYWRDEEYIGIGPSAHSFVDNKRFYYSRNLKEFYDGVTYTDGSGGDIQEYIMLALRLTQGVSVDNLKKRYNYSLSEKLVTRASKLKSEGLLNFDGEKLSLTKNGFLVSNSIINYLLDAL